MWLFLAIIPVVVIVAVTLYFVYRVIHSIRQYIAERNHIISTVTTFSRGENSERDLIYRLVKCGIPITTIFHDLYLPKKGGYTQIDLVVPTNVGIFVFEVKDYSGWIFGNANYDKWTQVLAYGDEKHQFYNPIKQNEGHISALKDSAEQLRNIPMYSIVVFYGSSEIRALSNVPENCWVVYPYQVGELVKNIMANAPPAPYTDKWEVMRILKSAVENGSNEYIRSVHMQNAQRASYGKYQSTYNYLPRLFRYGRRYRF